MANTAAHFQSYLRDRFKPNALCPLRLRRADFTRGAPYAIHQVYRGDSNALVSGLDVDAVYADPPYNKREYGWYYHIPETIAAGDEPSVEGKCGIRPWPDLSSSYCKKGEAARALADLVANSGVRHFFLDTVPAATSATHKYWKFSGYTGTSAFFNTKKGVIEVLAWRIRAPGSLSACTTSTEAGAGRIGSSYEASIPFEVGQALE